MKKGMDAAFMMADSLVALTVITIGINLFFICEQQLQVQRQREQLKLAAIRLGKEASDLYAIKHENIVLSKDKIVAKVNLRELTVYYQDECLYRIAK
ncbi:HEM-1/HEM-2 family protein [Limosilactobacillus caviae]|uniref:Late competence protein ComGE n=1 Tax=Limosilactobacillus caviae TaxID=1769424 RepID=A0ABQ2C5G9_9LACO|nr:HEM-1/HEM-2 family protein [Limosilactobacillus caviae]MCD7124540.1 HEM-1/HEM-2 family protein [Limosilactobacillus caviae]GGI63360.1 hypothetical protein GCM10011459_11940 [Limosilactobacillus caviae]